MNDDMAAEFGPEPPHDIGAEMVALGAMMLSPVTRDEVAEIIRPADHYRQGHRLIHEAILRLREGRQPTDPVAVLTELQRAGHLHGSLDGPYVHSLVAAVPSHVNGPHYAWTVREHSQTRDTQEALERALAMTRRPGFRPSQDMDLIRETVSGILGETGSTTGTAEWLSTAAWDLLGQLEKPLPPDLITPPYADLRKVIPALRPGQLITIAARPSIGKALALDTPLPTPAGWTTMGDVRTGDYLLGQDGKPTRVTAATEVMHGRPCFEVEFGDGTVIVADAEHRWLTETRAARRSEQQARTGYNRYKNQQTFPAVRTTAEIAATLRCATAEQRPNHAVTNCRPLDLPAGDLPVAAYTLGAWLGDGRSIDAVITTADPEILDEIRKDGYDVRQVGQIDYRFTSEPDRQARLTAAADLVRQGIPVRTAARHQGVGVTALTALTGPRRTNQIYNGKPTAPPRAVYQRIPEQLRQLGVLRNKHIPVIYLRASEDQRRALLAGLLDTDGYCNKSGTVQFAVTCRELALGTRELISSLGYTSRLTTKRVPGASEASSTCYIVTFTPPDKVFRLTRKAARQVCGERGRHSRRTIVDVRPVASVPVRCVAVDNADRLYLAGETCVPTHNTLVAGDFVRHAALRLGLPVAWFTLEMTREEIVTRTLAAEACVDQEHIQGHCLSDDELDRLAAAAADFDDSRLLIDEKSAATLSHIRSGLRRMQRTVAPRMAVVDYIQLAESPGAPSRQEEVSRLARGLKEIAKDHGIPVIIAAQLNRNPELRHDKKPIQADLRESGEIENSSDVIILLHREDYYEPESPRAGEMDLIVTKNRNGRSGITVTVTFQGPFCRCVDLSRQEPGPDWSPSRYAEETA